MTKRSFSTSKFELCNSRTRNRKKFKCKIKTLSFEVNLGKRKWFLNCSYNPPQSLIPKHLESLNHFIDKQSNTYNFILTEVFNVSIINYTSMVNVCNNGLKNSINVQTCYKNFYFPNSINFIFANRKKLVSSQ